MLREFWSRYNIIVVVVDIFKLINHSKKNILCIYMHNKIRLGFVVCIYSLSSTCLLNLYFQVDWVYLNVVKINLIFLKCNKFKSSLHLLHEIKEQIQYSIVYWKYKFGCLCCEKNCTHTLVVIVGGDPSWTCLLTLISQVIWPSSLSWHTHENMLLLIVSV